LSFFFLDLSSPSLLLFMLLLHLFLVLFSNLLHFHFVLNRLFYLFLLVYTNSYLL
jgi:hypothetical protein